MNEGISDYCHPCSSADSVMLMLIPPFGSADGGHVALLSHLLAGVATDVCAFRQQVLILTVHNAHPSSRSMCVTISTDGLAKAARRCTDTLSCVMPCTLTRGNPSYVILRGRDLCAGTLCMSVIPTLDVVQERKSVHVCVCPF